jgi:L-asparaginase
MDNEGSAGKILLLVTGGTFDKEYNELAGTLYFQDTHVPEMLRLGRCLLDVEVRTLLMIDSLEMTGEHRRLIARQCLDSSQSRIVITHGTDTMVETAGRLAREVAGKTIVLTGAMVPISSAAPTACSTSAARWLSSRPSRPAFTSR